MTKITEKQLIESLQQLKEIKPTTEWASLLKSQILAENVQPEVIAQKVSFMDVIASAFATRKLAYALSAFLFIVVGVFGMTQLLPSEKLPKQTAALTVQSGLNQDVETLNSRINDLALASENGATKSTAPAITEIKAQASQLAKNLKENPSQDPQTIKSIASSLKVLADVTGKDLSESTDIKDLYQTVVEQQIASEKTLTLTEDRKKILAGAEELYNQGKYSDALVLLMSK
ncbi:MAG: hypothetical protein NT094_01770 [Candidatus Staskawiczbacteria bacterium]|nr:hypothetical protein [Candidatus Staskawiczbacteria bacterium]